MIRVCVLGPSGRMGQRLIEQIEARDDMKLVAAVDRSDAPIIGHPVASGVLAIDDVALGLANADVYVDFTTPAATARIASLAAERHIPAVIGTTGLSEDAVDAIGALSAVAPVVLAPNFSLGVNLLIGLAAQAARALGPEYDVEIVELHHRHKRDAPSGTALAVAKSIAVARGHDYASVARHTRDGDVGPRPRGQIGVSAVRGGEIIGEHTAYFIGDNERVEISHRARDRGVFAAGALRAAAWVIGQPAGRYAMTDVLGL